MGFALRLSFLLEFLLETSDYKWRLVRIDIANDQPESKVKLTEAVHAPPHILPLVVLESVCLVSKSLPLFFRQGEALQVFQKPVNRLVGFDHQRAAT